MLERLHNTSKNHAIYRHIARGLFWSSPCAWVTSQHGCLCCVQFPSGKLLCQHFKMECLLEYLSPLVSALQENWELNTTLVFMELDGCWQLSIGDGEPGGTSGLPAECADRAVS